ncbi:hypothetical protein [Paraferrimonas sp. SM1919]|uniref:hypothetical protein n=1 Tax=Paraferrimonas sp. SM1919 TaxID=2662263 RepID=UPI0013D780A8|nr:hypothetical protein [Paraferrimonas sp. SM1919]
MDLTKLTTAQRNALADKLNQLLHDNDPLGLIWGDDQQDEYAVVAEEVLTQHTQLTPQTINKALLSCLEICVDDEKILAEICSHF